MVVQDRSNDTLSSNNCTALTNSLVLPITCGRGEKEGQGNGEGRKERGEKARSTNVIGEERGREVMENGEQVNENEILA